MSPILFKAIDIQVLIQVILIPILHQEIRTLEVIMLTVMLTGTFGTLVKEIKRRKF